MVGVSRRSACKLSAIYKHKLGGGISQEYLRDLKATIQQIITLARADPLWRRTTDIDKYALTQWHATRRATNAAHPSTTRATLQRDINPLTENTFYADVGRLKWHFMRTLVNIWVEGQPNQNLIAHSFSVQQVLDSRAKADRGESFQIPSDITGLRARASFVREVLKKRTADFIYRNNYPQPGRFIHMGIPESLHGRVAGESFGSNLARRG